jgi:hypothetical protein
MPARPELVEAQVVDQDDEEVGTLDRRRRRNPGSLARPVVDRPADQLDTRTPLPAEMPEKLAHITDQELRDLQGREVAAALELGPAHDVVLAPGPASDRHVLCQRDRHPGRNPVARLFLSGVRLVERLVVEIRR